MKKNIIFLDIDGVIFPSQNRLDFSVSAKALKESLATKFQDDGYLSLSDFDITVICKGWDKQALQRILYVCKHCDAYIVISSSWKFGRDLKTLKRLFQPFGLAEYIIDKTSDAHGYLKEPAINAYLLDHTTITNYVVLDDLPMEQAFPNHSVTCPDIFNEDCLKKTIKILKKKAYAS